MGKPRTLLSVLCLVYLARHAILRYVEHSHSPHDPVEGLSESPLDDAPCAQCGPCAEANSQLTRRELLAQAAGALGLVLVGSVAGATILSGCTSSSGSESAPPVPGKGPGASPLQALTATAEGKSFRVAGGGKVQAGTALAFTYGDGAAPGILFIADGQLKALSARCTHKGCTVEWSADGKPHLHCPCHSSDFDLTGKVMNGPARKPLPDLAAQKDGDDALVTPPAAA